MVDVEDLTRDLFGIALPNLECTLEKDINVNRCSVNLDQSKKFTSLLDLISSKRYVFKDLNVLQAMIRVGMKFYDAKLISGDFWWTLMVSYML